MTFGKDISIPKSIAKLILTGHTHWNKLRVSILTFKVFPNSDWTDGTMQKDAKVLTQLPMSACSCLQREGSCTFDESNSSGTEGYAQIMAALLQIFPPYSINHWMSRMAYFSVFGQFSGKEFRFDLKVRNIPIWPLIWVLFELGQWSTAWWPPRAAGTYYICININLNINIYIYKYCTCMWFCKITCI